MTCETTAYLRSQLSLWRKRRLASYVVLVFGAVMIGLNEGFWRTMYVVSVVFAVFMLGLCSWSLRLVIEQMRKQGMIR